MLKKTHNRLQKFWLGLALTSVTAMGLGGGFFLSVSTPERPSDDSVLLVSPQGCGQPSDAKISGSAEGLVKGHRLSLPLDMKMDSSGTYRIRREWPQEGVWVLAVTATYGGLTRSVLVELGSDGFARTARTVKKGSTGELVPWTSLRKLTSGEIDTALQALSGQRSP